MKYTFNLIRTDSSVEINGLWPNITLISLFNKLQEAGKKEQNASNI